MTLTGHASVFLAGTTTPITSAPIFAPNFIIVPGAAAGQLVGGGTNFMQLNWPSLNPKLPAGPPIVRIQLGDWDPSVGSGSVLDVQFDLETIDAVGNVITQWNGAASQLFIP